MREGVKLSEEVMSYILLQVKDRLNGQAVSVSVEELGVFPEPGDALNSDGRPYITIPI